MKKIALFCSGEARSAPSQTKTKAESGRCPLPAAPHAAPAAGPAPLPTAPRGPSAAGPPLAPRPDRFGLKPPFSAHPQNGPERGGGKRDEGSAPAPTPCARRRRQCLPPAPAPRRRSEGTRRGETPIMRRPPAPLRLPRVAFSLPFPSPPSFPRSPFFSGRRGAPATPCPLPVPPGQDDPPAARTGGRSGTSCSRLPPPSPPSPPAFLPPAATHRPASAGGAPAAARAPAPATHVPARSGAVPGRAGPGRARQGSALTLLALVVPTRPPGAVSVVSGGSAPAAIPAGAGPRRPRRAVSLNFSRIFSHPPNLRRGAQWGEEGKGKGRRRSGSPVPSPPPRRGRRPAGRSTTKSHLHPGKCPAETPPSTHTPPRPASPGAAAGLSIPHPPRTAAGSEHPRAAPLCRGQRPAAGPLLHGRRPPSLPPSAPSEVRGHSPGRCVAVGDRCPPLAPSLPSAEGPGRRRGHAPELVPSAGGGEAGEAAIKRCPPVRSRQRPRPGGVALPRHRTGTGTGTGSGSGSCSAAAEFVSAAFEFVIQSETNSFLVNRVQSRPGTTTRGSSPLPLELCQRRDSGTGSRQILPGQGGATGRLALGVTQKPIAWSQGMIFLMQSPLPRFRAVAQWCGSTRGQRGEDAAACKGVGRAGERIPEGSPGWAGEAAWLPHGHCSFRERDAAYPAPLSAGRGGLPAPLRAPSPGGLRSFERSRCFAALLPGPQRGRSTVPRPSRQARTPPFRVPRDSQAAPGHRLRIAAGMGRGPEGCPPRRAASQGRSSRALPGAMGGAPQRWRDRPRHRSPLPAPPPPAGRSCRGDGSTPSPGTGLRWSHGNGALLSRLPWGTPSRPLPRRQRGRPRAATSARTGFPAPAAPARRHRSPPASPPGHPHRGRVSRPVGTAVCGARHHLQAPRAGKAAPV
ncbi:uncharacterized protein LOC132326348 [Haemorhous mexicanus]|uniref:uncharacterized protein LOC132326348 n=1 Tax=Haemorhous mexicanus TaxID=30427 RepID=UPI0028BD77C3|nr:uncharacterized protein LOC132326348 [Haemorhous mexicanus]